MLLFAQCNPGRSPYGKADLYFQCILKSILHEKTTIDLLLSARGCYYSANSGFLCMIVNSFQRTKCTLHNASNLKTRKCIFYAAGFRQVKRNVYTVCFSSVVTDLPVPAVKLTVQALGGTLFRYG